MSVWRKVTTVQKMLNVKTCLEAILVQVYTLDYTFLVDNRLNIILKLNK